MKSETVQLFTTVVQISAYLLIIRVMGSALTDAGFLGAVEDVIRQLVSNY